MDQQLITIPKLTLNGNYLLWKIRISSFLEAKGWLKTVDEKTEHDCKVRNVLITTVDDELLQIIANCITASDMWKKLNNHFTGNVENKKYLIYKKFRYIKIDKNETVEQFIKRYDEIIKEASKLDQEFVFMNLFAALEAKEELKTIITVLENETEMNYEQVKTRLIIESTKGKLINLPNFGNNNVAICNIKCNGCGKMGHKVANCYFKDKVCKLCKQKGHIDKFCKKVDKKYFEKT